MTTRRNFLGIMLGAAAAPAIVKAENLMKIIVPKKELIVGPYTHYNLMDLNAINIFNDSCHPQRRQMYAGHFDQFPNVAEDGIVISERLSEKLRFKTFPILVEDFGNGKYPLNLYESLRTGVTVMGA